MKKHIGILLLFAVITCIITYPLIFHFATLSFGKADELLIAWIMNWNIHQIFSNPLQLFDANIFHPYPNSLSFSDLHLTSSFIGMLPFLITKEPLVVYNFNVIISITLLAFFSYLFVYSLTRNIYSSFLSGLSLAFSPFMLGRVFQLQVPTVYWIPLSLLFYFRFIKSYKSSDYAFMCIFSVLQILNSFLPGYFLLLCYMVLIIMHTIQKKIILKKIFTRNIILISIITIFFVILVSIPYFQTSRQFQLKRDIRDTIHFANRPEYLLYPNDKTRLKNTLLDTIYKNDKGPYTYDGYLGLGLSALIIICLICFFKNQKYQNLLTTSFLWISVISFVLSLGPALQWAGKVIKLPFIIPLPYAIFYFVIPGFSGLRNSSRFEVLTIFAFCVFIGVVLHYLLKNKSKKFQLYITIIISFFILCEINFPFKYVSIPSVKSFPSIYKYLGTLPKKTAIIHMPIYTWEMLPYSLSEFEREFYSTVNFRKTVNGYSGFSPIEWEKKARMLLAQFPDIKTLQYLKKINVNYIVIHSNEYDNLVNNRYKIYGFPIRSSKEVLQFLDRNQDVQLINRLDMDYVYKIK